MRLRFLIVLGGFGAAAALGGCAAGDGLGLTTASLQEPAAATTRTKPTIDPACVELAAKINAARAEGTPDRVAKVADGNGRMVNIKRASLAKVAELDALNKEFLQRCSVVANAPAPAVAPASAAAAATASVASQTQPILDPPKAQ